MAGISFSFGWEDNLILFIQRYMTDFLIKLAGIITEFGDATVLVGVIGLLYWALNKDLGKKLVIYLGLVNLINPCLKAVVTRRRPYMANSRIKCLKQVNKEGDMYDIVSQEYSFPSGHSANGMGIYGALVKYARKIHFKVILCILIALIGFSRFALGVHYPTDVLAGWAIACISITLYCLLEKKLGRNKMYILLDILGIFGFFVATTNDYYTGYGLMIGSTLGILFEEKYVQFKGTRRIIPAIIRTLIGVGLFIGLNELLKLPFTDTFLNSGTTLAFIVRTLRYAIVVFILVGLYPKCFTLLKEKETSSER